MAERDGGEEGAVLTRLPLAIADGIDATALARARRWFPLVGLAKGTLIGAVCVVALVVAPSSVAVLAALAAGTVLGGGASPPALLLLARFVLLWELTVGPPATLVAALAAAHVLALWSAVMLAAGGPGRRSAGGDGRLAIEGVGRTELAGATLVAALALAPPALVAGGALYLLWPLAAALAWLVGHVARRRGALDERAAGRAVELAVLAAVLLATRV